MRKLFLILLGFVMFASAHAYSYEFFSNQSFSATEKINITAQPDANITIFTDTWLYPSVAFHDMQGNDSFILSVNISVLANTTSGNYTRYLNYSSTTNTTGQSLFYFQILEPQITNLTNGTNETNQTIWVNPNLKFVIRAKDGGLLQYANINLTSTNFSAFGSTGDNGECEFSNMTPAVYQYYITRNHYYSEQGEVTLGNDSLTKTIIMDYLESDLAMTINDNIKSLQDTQFTMASLYINNSITALQMRVADLEDANNNKDNRIYELSQMINEAHNQTQMALESQDKWWNNWIRQRNMTAIVAVAVAFATFITILGGIYLKNNWVRITFF